jgi:hypothetical protein
MSVSADFSDIEKMLKKCAPGYTVRVTTHSRQVRFEGKVYPSLPKHKAIEHGYIRKLVSFLGISIDCASRHLPAVKFREEPKPPKTKESSTPVLKSKGKLSTST